MSLKITVEVDGQSEQQLIPVVAQFVARHPANHPEGIGASTPTRSAEPSPSNFYHDNSALLQQHIQQLMAQNMLLQEQVTDSQRLLAGGPQAKALLPQATDSNPVFTPSACVAFANSAQPSSVQPSSAQPSSVPPLLPVQYQSNKGARALYRLKRSLVKVPTQLWRSLIWVAWGKEWLLLFLLLCGGMYGVLTVAPKLADLWPPLEFVDSAGGGPGATAEPIRESDKDSGEEKAPDKAPDKAPPEAKQTEAKQISPRSKAGSHPPPPPAFQQP